jgi:hypothetical protein
MAAMLQHPGKHPAHENNALGPIQVLPLPELRSTIEQSSAMPLTRGSLFSPRLLTCHLLLLRGYQFKAGFLDGIKREVITIYEILRDSANNLLYAVPDYQFRCALLLLP